jgi:hypothetical protein
MILSANAAEILDASQPLADRRNQANASEAPDDNDSTRMIRRNPISLTFGTQQCRARNRRISSMNS